jgi:hypothetical protein
MLGAGRGSRGTRYAVSAGAAGLVGGSAQLKLEAQASRALESLSYDIAILSRF